MIQLLLSFGLLLACGDDHTHTEQKETTKKEPDNLHMKMAHSLEQLLVEHRIMLYTYTVFCVVDHETYKNCYACVSNAKPEDSMKLCEKERRAMHPIGRCYDRVNSCDDLED